MALRDDYDPPVGGSSETIVKASTHRERMTWFSEQTDHIEDKFTEEVEEVKEVDTFATVPDLCFDDLIYPSDQETKDLVLSEAGLRSSGDPELHSQMEEIIKSSGMTVNEMRRRLKTAVVKIMSIENDGTHSTTYMQTYEGEENPLPKFNESRNDDVRRGPNKPVEKLPKNLVAYSTWRKPNNQTKDRKTQPASDRRTNKLAMSKEAINNLGRGPLYDLSVDGAGSVCKNAGAPEFLSIYKGEVEGRHRKAAKKQLGRVAATEIFTSPRNLPRTTVDTRMAAYDLIPKIYSYGIESVVVSKEDQERALLTNFKEGIRRLKAMHVTIGLTRAESLLHEERVHRDIVSVIQSATIDAYVDWRCLSDQLDQQAGYREVCGSLHQDLWACTDKHRAFVKARKEAGRAYATTIRMLPMIGKLPKQKPSPTEKVAGGDCCPSDLDAIKIDAAKLVLKNKMSPTKLSEVTEERKEEVAECGPSNIEAIKKEAEELNLEAKLFNIDMQEINLETELEQEMATEQEAGENSLATPEEIDVRPDSVAGTSRAALRPRKNRKMENIKSIMTNGLLASIIGAPQTDARLSRG